MKLIFRAIDGTDFESALECERHEIAISKKYVSVRIKTTVDCMDALIEANDDITEFVYRMFPRYKNKNAVIYVNARPLYMLEGNTLFELGLEDSKKVNIHVIPVSGTTA